MYAILVKNNESYDLIGKFYHSKQTVMDALASAHDTGLPITGIEASAHKQTALYGATWNGSSFSGGTAGPNLHTATQEQLDSFNLYVFLCNNVVVARIAVAVESPKAEMFSAAFTSEVVLIKIPAGQNLTIGQSYSWDGTAFTELA
jgi:hypothetical protein